MCETKKSSSQRNSECALQFSLHYIKFCMILDDSLPAVRRGHRGLFIWAVGKIF